MSQVQLFNGEFYPEGAALLSVSNRSFCYGDGFFESMRVSNGKVVFLDLHFQRLSKACNFLKLKLPASFSAKYFNQMAVELTSRNALLNARIRFQGFRSGGGRYTPESDLLEWSMVCQPLEESQFVLNSKGLRVGVCESHKINPAPLSSFKTSNSLPYVLGGIYAREKNWDDCFMVDAEDFIAESTTSNIFVLKGNKLLTPDLSNGGVAGVMRSVVLSEAAHVGMTTETALITLEDILAADECFLTNAARGIQWVGAVDKKRYYKRGATKLIEHINKKFGLS